MSYATHHADSLSSALPPVDWLDQAQAAEALAGLKRTFQTGAEALDRSATFPWDNFAVLHQQGLLGLTVPKAYGGLGGSLADAARVIGEVAYGEPSTALILVMQYMQHGRLHSSPHWPAHLRERVSLDAVRNGALVNALRVEPDLGTPARGGLPGTVARRTDEGWRLSGSKIYSTGSYGLTWYLVWARSDDPDPLVGAWLVHKDSPGIRIIEDWDHLGMRATCSHEIRFDDVLVPLDHAVNVSPWSAHRPELDAEAQLWMAVLISSVYDGVARAARDWFVNWLQDRKPANLGAALATLPRFQEIVGRIDSQLFSSQLLLESAAQGRVAPERAGQVKFLVTNQAIQAVELAVQASGNPGLSRRNALERHYRDVLCSRIHTPQDDTLLINSGKAAFAQAAEPASHSGRGVV